jgi:hypothetical protein
VLDFQPARVPIKRRTEFSVTALFAIAGGKRAKFEGGILAG